MNAQTPTTAAALDQQNYLSVRDARPQDLLVHAAKASGRSVLKIQRDYRQMARSHSRLNLVEYVRHGLFREGFSEAQRATYISNDRHWEFTHQCNDKGWSAAAEDKVLAATLLSAGGVPVPELLGVVDRSARLYPGVAKIDRAAALRDLILAYRDDGLFGKIVGGMVSFGVFRIEAADDTHVTCAGHAPMTYQGFLDDFIGSNAYALQTTLRNHGQIAPYASALATVRMINMVSDDGVFCPQAILKLPQGDNIADAFWRPGNLACAVDVDTGEIRTVAERDRFEVTFHEDHPATPGLRGLTLPHWDQLREVNARAARIFAPIRYQSTDIALTEDGPVVVELNYGGGFDLPQYASGEGMLTPEVRAFFEAQGCKIDAPARRGFFRRR